MINYLGHEFSNGRCVHCSAVEKSVRQFQAQCIPTNAPAVRVPDAERPDVTPAGELEYKVLSRQDKLFSGRFDSAALTEALNTLAAEGWRLVAVSSSGINTLLGGNRDEIMIFLERKRQRN